jgi:hypothetical protein
MQTRQWASILLCLLFLSAASAQSLQIQTRDGKLYKNATVEKADPAGLTISYDIAGGGIGITKLKFSNLPDDLQKKYGYNATNAAAFETQQRAGMAQWRQQLIANDSASRKINSAEQFKEELNDEIGQATQYGTGFFITDDGYVLTCNHVISNTSHVVVSTRNAVYSAEVVRADPESDFALLKVEGQFHALPFITCTNAKLGDSIFTIGFPVVTLQGLDPKLTSGAINSLEGVQDDPDQFQISAEVQPGNSGGPLVDEYGNVIGVVAARMSEQVALNESGMLPENVNYANKSSKAFPLLNNDPELLAKLKKPYPPADRRFADIVQQTEDSVVLVLAY